MNSSSDLADMLAQVALGSRSDFQRLYQRTSAKLFGVCLRILNDRADAEEALQETYVKVWRSADRFASGRASPISWLAAIARNTAIDRYRARRPETAEIEEAEAVVDETASPEDVAALSGEVERLEACMSELDVKHAEAIRKVYLGGWTYAEAAEKLEVPLNTVKTWIRRSLMSLRDCLSR